MLDARDELMTETTTRPGDEIEALAPWFHNLHLPDGTQTAPGHPLGDFPSVLWERICEHVPEDLAGWRVLDVGCNAGFYSFELARRGAEVTAIDLDEHYLRQARWAARAYGLENRVEFRRMQVYDLARVDETWDLVWFMGVFYHLRYPLLALDVLSRRSTKLMMFQCMEFPGEEPLETPGDVPLDQRSRLLEPGWPRMAFLEKCVAGDPTNWWAPDRACSEAVLRASGFRVVGRPCPEVYLCEKAEGPHPLGIEGLLEAEYRAATGT
jgi:tRNA (mo5U34)-methyltransferase